MRIKTTKPGLGHTLRRGVLGAIAVAACAAATPASAVVFGGTDFPLGAASFADAVVAYTPGPDVGAPHDDPTRALGPNDGLFTSLGDGGSLTLQFLDNALLASGDASADLAVLEISGVVENFRVEISTDDVVYLDLGVFTAPANVYNAIDIDAGGALVGVDYRFVRLSDVGGSQTGSPTGEADIDSVGAINARAVPEPLSLGLFGLGLLALGARRTRHARSA